MTFTRGPEPALAAGPALVTGENTLARGALSTWDAIAISVSPERTARKACPIA